ncbi:MAG: hypothetical protein C0504_02010 [Candidatus Solibacter sp.]|nr:hypothetical protein [Candidatus Solibacter sp.]
MPVLAFVLLLAPPSEPAPPPIALDEILARVAGNQEKTEEARARIVYQQSVRTRLLRGGGRLAREEKRFYTVTPTDKGTEKQLDKLEGLYEKGGKLHPYSDPKFRHKNVDLDGELAESVTDDLVNDKKSRDGISRDLFPLTPAEQRHYDFRFDGYQNVAGVRAIRLAFSPRKRAKDDACEEDCGRPWSGTVLIDPEEFQPLSVATTMSNVIPGWVKVVFGINLKQLGFSLTYRKVAGGLWFPATYGTEFGLRVLFGYGRTVTMSMENTDFRLASAESSIVFVEPAAQ